MDVLEPESVEGSDRRLRELEEANRELRRANEQLARERIGTADTAAARLLKNVQEETERVRAEAEEAVRLAEERMRDAEARMREAQRHADLEEFRWRHLESVMFELYGSLSWRLTAPLRGAKRMLLRLIGRGSSR